MRAVGGFAPSGKWITFRAASQSPADVRVHGTTHERPCDRWAVEAPALNPTTGHPSFALEAPVARVVATDYLVSFEANRYSVPYALLQEATAKELPYTDFLDVVLTEEVTAKTTKNVAKGASRTSSKSSPCRAC